MGRCSIYMYFFTIIPCGITTFFLPWHLLWTTWAGKMQLSSRHQRPIGPRSHVQWHLSLRSQGYAICAETTRLLWDVGLTGHVCSLCLSWGIWGMCVRWCSWGPITTLIEVCFSSASNFKGQITHLSKAFPQTDPGSRGDGTREAAPSAPRYFVPFLLMLQPKPYRSPSAKVLLETNEAMTINSRRPYSEQLVFQTWN